ncbi:MAG TPA: thiosulfohydrolase SoxB [Burkholderiales bacterium]
MDRREFLKLLSLATAAGAGLRPGQSEAQAADALYRVPRYGNVSLLHITDTHAQLLPTYFREPEGEDFLKKYRLQRGSRPAYAHTHLDYETLARRYGKIGGFAHLAALLKRLRASRPGALTLDGGDSWQGSATSLWTQGADMIGAQRLLGVHFSTGHWEFTYGAARVRSAVERELTPMEFLAQNVRTADFEEPVFKPYALRLVNHQPVAIIGQAYPYTPIANPRHLVPNWTFGIQEKRLQGVIDQARGKGARAVVLLSHNGRDIDLKLASRVRGLDAILGGHTHDALPEPVKIGATLVTNAGCNGKFVGVLDLQVGSSGVTGARYHLLPVFSNLIPPDAEMARYVEKARQPFEKKLSEPLAVTEGTLYRRGTYNGSFDQLILDALLAQKQAQIAFSPGFRWGTTLLAGDTITFEQLMDQTAITYPQVTLNALTGAQIKSILEDIADNLFHPDPYLRQGGDMVRVAGMSYAVNPAAAIGSRISDMRLGGEPMGADKSFKVAGWASVQEGVTGEPVWDLVGRHLRALKTIPAPTVNQPRAARVKE